MCLDIQNTQRGVPGDLLFRVEKAIVHGNKFTHAVCVCIASVKYYGFLANKLRFAISGGNGNLQNYKKIYEFIY